MNEARMNERRIVSSPAHRLSDARSAGTARTGALVEAGRASSAKLKLADLDSWRVLLCVLVLGFAFLGARGLWEPDEGRYSAVALNMIETGDYLVPRLNREHAHFAKPPMTYWAVAASIATFGRNEWSVRLPSALAYVATALIVALLGTALGLRRPWMAAAIWSTTLLPFVAASVITAVLLVALRLVSSNLTSGRDARQLADDLRASVDLRRYDTLFFVDHYRPAYGLEFYTGKDVDALWDGSSHDYRSRRPCAELAQKGVSLVLVARRRLDEYRRAAGQCSAVTVVALGSVQRFDLFEVSPRRALPR